MCSAGWPFGRTGLGHPGGRGSHTDSIFPLLNRIIEITIIFSIIIVVIAIGQEALAVGQL
jgi:hypothetical protein